MRPLLTDPQLHPLLSDLLREGTAHGVIILACLGPCFYAPQWTHPSSTCPLSPVPVLPAPAEAILGPSLPPSPCPPSDGSRGAAKPGPVTHTVTSGGPCLVRTMAPACPPALKSQAESQCPLCRANPSVSSELTGAELCSNMPPVAPTSPIVAFPVAVGSSGVGELYMPLSSTPMAKPKANWSHLTFIWAEGPWAEQSSLRRLLSGENSFWARHQDQEYPRHPEAVRAASSKQKETQMCFASSSALGHSWMLRPTG